ncbi:hypothetical protein JYU14_04045 [Simkania negevensis]|uniref:Coil containing protein n=1 Tax=Simkania negevensis TaxID=83561 RepID=A0ABS3AR74_9BACT|nr:hypothetical protein [Simkania negevensis]
MKKLLLLAVVVTGSLGFIGNVAGSDFACSSNLVDSLNSKLNTLHAEVEQLKTIKGSQLINRKQILSATLSNLSNCIGIMQDTYSDLFRAVDILSRELGD